MGDDEGHNSGEGTTRPIVQIGDITGLSKPAEKLVDHIAYATGQLFLPWQTRRMAKADAERIRVIAQAEGDRAILVGEGQATAEKLQEAQNLPLNERARITQEYKAIQDQINRESIFQEA